MELTQEQKLIQDMVRKFASSELLPVVAELDKSATYPHEIIKKLAELGFLGITIPEKYGGANLDTVSYCIIIEELSRIFGSIGTILIVNNALVAYPILKYGNEGQKSQWLTPLAKGDIIGAFAITEGTGFNFSDIETKATKINNGYGISGKKDFIPNAEAAKLFVIFANTENGVTAFLVDRESAGLKVTEKEDTLGIRSAGICNLEFNELKVSANAILGKEGDGLKISEEAINLASIGTGAQAVGIGQAALDDSIKYSKERHQFGRPICEFQLVQDMLIEMKIKVEAARLLVYDTAIKCDSGSSFGQDAAIAKLFATDAAMVAGIKSIQVYGGYGYTKDYPVERYFRDAKVIQVWGESSIAQKIKIAKALLE
ncbi:MAG: acyl-CoA dehydrogenase family protein [bacterium]|nr:acyl-CoA dehydrogenase family protein [bacterium]